VSDANAPWVGYLLTKGNQMFVAASLDKSLNDQVMVGDVVPCPFDCGGSLFDEEQSTTIQMIPARRSRMIKTRCDKCNVLFYACVPVSRRTT
jgi:hypothetical protein